MRARTLSSRGAMATWLVVALMLSGCKGEEEAREYARGLIDVLKTYQAEMLAKSDAEQKAYKALARIYGEAADTDLLASLSTERRERGDRLSDLSLRGSPPSPIGLKDMLKDYASRDIDSTRELLLRESDNYDKHLSALNKLAVDTAAIGCSRPGADCSDEEALHCRGDQIPERLRHIGQGMSG